MKAKMLLLSLLVSLSGITMAQDQAPSPQSRPELSSGRAPPPHAYEDCKGKKVGDAVQHMTREGQVAATCEDSPEGLVARPNQRPGARPDY